VLVLTFTFPATTFGVSDTSSTPDFVDSEKAAWNVDAPPVEQVTQQLDRQGRPPKSLMAADL